MGIYMGLSKQVIESLPKIELHRHLDGDIKPDLIFELAKEQNIKLPVDNKKDLNRYFSKKREEGFNSLITDGFGLVNTVLQTGEALRRAAYESVRNMKNENIIYGELRFAPELHTEKGLSYKQAIYEARMGMKEAEKDFGISTNLISCICRNSSAELGEQIAKTVMDSQMYTVALDLACDEANNPPEKHKKAYELTFNTDIKRTVHAGELGNNQYQNMVTAINTLHADRISHAIHISEYKDLINIVREKNIGIEMSPKSNIYCKFIKSTKDLNITKLIKENVLVSINSDDPAMFEYTLCDTLYEVADDYNLEIGSLKQLQLNAIQMAFTNNKIKEKLRRIITDTYK